MYVGYSQYKDRMKGEERREAGREAYKEVVEQ